MANATGATAEVGYIAEVTIGTTPATPNFKKAHQTGFSLLPTKEVLTAPLLGGRNKKCTRGGNISVAGDLSTLLITSHQNDLIEAALGGTWAVDTPVVGTQQLTNGDTRRGFTFYRKDPNIGADSYRYYRGTEVNTLALALAQNDNVTLTLGLVGIDAPAVHTEIAGSTYTALPSECPFDYKQGSIVSDSVTLAKVTDFSLNIENGITQSFVLFSTVTGDKPNGEFNVTGSLSLQFDSLDMYGKFINDTDTDLVLTMIDDAGNQHEVTLPAITITEHGDPIEGPGEIILNLAFEAKYDSVSGSTIIWEWTPV